MLRQQLIVLQERRGQGSADRRRSFAFVQLYRWFPSIRPVLQIVRPETLVRWHRAGFCSCWRWKFRNEGQGGVRIDME